MVVVGLTAMLVPVTTPTLGDIESVVVAPVTLHASVVLVPATMLAGVAVKDAITGLGGNVTVTLAVLVAVPALLVAVNV